jgi:hypothetical protein
MQFNVPQFIDIEDKLIGPLSLKQFLFVAAGGGVLFILWFYLKLFAFIIIAIPIIVFCLSLAFYKINGQPFGIFLINGLKFVFKPKLYLWRKR